MQELLPANFANAAAPMGARVPTVQPSGEAFAVVIANEPKAGIVRVATDGAELLDQPETLSLLADVEGQGEEQAAGDPQFAFQSAQPPLTAAPHGFPSLVLAQLPKEHVEDLATADPESSSVPAQPKPVEIDTQSIAIVAAQSTAPPTNALIGTLPGSVEPRNFVGPVDINTAPKPMANAAVPDSITAASPATPAPADPMPDRINLTTASVPPPGQTSPNGKPAVIASNTTASVPTVQPVDAAIDVPNPTRVAEPSIAPAGSPRPHMDRPDFVAPIDPSLSQSGAKEPVAAKGSASAPVISDVSTAPQQTLSQKIEAPQPVETEIQQAAGRDAPIPSAQVAVAGARPDPRAVNASTAQTFQLPEGIETQPPANANFIEPPRLADEPTAPEIQTAARPATPVQGVHQFTTIDPQSNANPQTPLGPELVAADPLASNPTDRNLDFQTHRTDRIQTVAPELPQRITQQIVDQIKAGPDNAIEITLSPEELGRVRMTLHPNEGAMAVVMSFERGETLDLMRRHIETLAAEMREMGYRDVSFQFDGGDHPSQQDPQDSPNEKPSQATPSMPGPGPADQITRQTSATRLSGLDLRL